MGFAVIRRRPRFHLRNTRAGRALLSFTDNDLLRFLVTREGKADYSRTVSADAMFEQRVMCPWAHPKLYARRRCFVSANGLPREAKTVGVGWADSVNNARSHIRNALN